MAHPRLFSASFRDQTTLHLLKFRLQFLHAALVLSDHIFKFSIKLGWYCIEVFVLARHQVVGFWWPMHRCLWPWEETSRGGKHSPLRLLGDHSRLFFQVSHFYLHVCHLDHELSIPSLKPLVLSCDSFCLLVIVQRFDLEKFSLQVVVLFKKDFHVA